MNYACCRCTRLTNCVLVGQNAYCEDCFKSRMNDPDGKTDFIKVCEKFGIVQIE